MNDSLQLLQTRLTALEVQGALVAKKMLNSDPAELVRACADLQGAAAGFFDLVQHLPNGFKPDRPLLLRMQKFGALLASCRESSVRQTVAASSALSALMPTLHGDNTYAPASALSARQPYGSIGRQSGQFRVALA